MAALADALRHFGAAYLATHALSTSQAKAWRAIVACRTAALGGPADIGAARSAAHGPKTPGCKDD